MMGHAATVHGSCCKPDRQRREAGGQSHVERQALGRRHRATGPDRPPRSHRRVEAGFRARRAALQPRRDAFPGRPDPVASIAPHILTVAGAAPGLHRLPNSPARRWTTRHLDGVIVPEPAAKRKPNHAAQPPASSMARNRRTTPVPASGGERWSSPGRSAVVSLPPRRMATVPRGICRTTSGPSGWPSCASCT